jgi:hypothetical protein
MFALLNSVMQGMNLMQVLVLLIALAALGLSIVAMVKGHKKSGEAYYAAQYPGDFHKNLHYN